MLKAIVTDMDGTLLAPGDHILPETKQKLLELEKQGVTLILASGRSYTRLLGSFTVPSEHISDWNF